MATKIVSQEAENYFAYYRTQYGWEVQVLRADDAIRPNFEHMVKEWNPDLIVYIGHGMQGKLLGQCPRCWDEPLLDIKNVDLLRGRKIVAIACYGGTLGKDAIAAGAEMYVGFMDLVYVGGWEPDHNYVADFVATFMNIIINTAKEMEPKEILEDYVRLCNYYISLYNERKWEFYETYAMYMEHNRDILKIFV